jgi:predicted lysophospholipase L1 biosynthesis ABC-type transport system permease subunit
MLAFAPQIDVWKPIAPTNSELRNEDWNLGLLVRLRPGENPERGRQQLQSILNAFVRAQEPGIKTELIAQLVPIREIYAGKARLRLLLILAASALLLLTACTNLANLLLARVASRAAEFATRIALGAGRGRILSQTLTETILLAILGGAIGAVIAEYGAGLLTAYGPDDVRLLTGIPSGAHLNLSVFLFALAASLVTGIVCGVFPAWQAYRNDAAVGLRERARWYGTVTTGYFAASGTALRAGRFFAEQEPVPVALISESLAIRLWPRETPAAVVGRTLRQGDVTGPLITVAGVVGDVRPGAVDREPPPLIYRPHRQWAGGQMTLMVKTAREPAALAPAVRAEIRKMDSSLPIPTIRTMREIVSASVAERRFQMVLTSLFALLALLLGAVGVYGVVSYSVACRTRDIGLRIALGAMRSHVMRWVFSQGMRPVLIGLLAGLGGSIAVARALRGLLFGIAPTDPISLGSVALVLLLVSGLACYLPARRAARLDPTMAIRHE